MSERKPTVTAEFEAGPVDVINAAGDKVVSRPGVFVTVTFELGSHSAALAELKAAYTDVVRQIAESAEEQA